MISEVSMRSEMGEELSIYRSGSAPPTVEGSLSAVGGLFNGFATEEELRADPAYANYYYSNLNLNPRLPPPLVSKEDWRFSQRRHAGSLFSVQPGGNEDHAAAAAEDHSWGGADGLIGLTGLAGGLPSRQKTISEILQDDMNQAKTVQRQPSRPASRNAFDEGVESSESQFAHLHHDLSSLRSGGGNNNKQSVQTIGSSASHSYASALGTSLSRSNTPDPQLIARAPSPRIPTAIGGRSTPIERRTVNAQSSFNGASHKLGESEDLVAALSGMSLSTGGGMMDEEARSHRSQIQHELDNRHQIFNPQSDPNHMKPGSYLNKSDSGHGHFRGHSLSQPNKTSYHQGMDSSPTLNGRGGSSSHYHNMDSPNSSFQNYGLGGYGMSPPSPSMMGSPMGSGHLPPLYESAANSAMGGIDSGAFGGGLTLGPSMLAVAAELQNAGRLGNQVPLMDPLYLQYLRTNNEYAAAAQAAALNEASMEREGMGNAYMDLYGLQKAYLGSLISSQKSQFGGGPYMGKSSSMNQGYYGNPGYGLGMSSYPGSPLGGPLLPNSPVGSGSPGRHGDRNLRFSSGMRNISGMMGGWHSEAGGKLDEIFPSSLLDEFKSNKTKCFELAEIAGHVVEFSADQYGSRFIQQKLETATLEEKNMVFNEIMPQGLSLMTDVFGNYVIQKFFEHGTSSQTRELAEQLTGHVLTLSLQMYGCRVIQKAIEVVELDQQTKMVMELDGHIMRCVRDQNGNHVIQKCIECVPEEAIHFIVSTFYDQVVTLSTHPYGCRVIQRVLEHCHNPKTQQIMMDEILLSVCMLAQDQYGNYVVQHVLEHGKPHERTSIIRQLTGQIVQMSQQKFASNVVEKCLSFGTIVERQTLVTEMLGTTDENEPLQAMMKDQFANYVVQKVLETCDDQQLELILNRIKVHLNALKKYTYGKHIVARVEKLVAAGEKRISILTPHPQPHPHPIA